MIQRRSALFTATLGAAALGGVWMAQAQTPPASAPPAGSNQTVPEKDQTRPRDQPRSEGGGGSDPSTTLNRTDGVIKPPTGVDPGIQKSAPAPNAGTMPVVPPPGSPGGRTDVVPK